MVVDANTRLLALLGHPVEHSLSPRMQNAALRHAGINAIYLAFAPPPEGLRTAVQGLKALGCRGWNVTAPHKKACARLADTLRGPARALGAVNTMLYDGQELIGHNTDVTGLARAWQEHGVQPGQHLLVLGAGGAAYAVAWAACQSGLSLTVGSRSPADDLLETVHTHFEPAEASWCPWDQREEAARRADIVVNATPLTRPLPPASLRPTQLICDLVYGRGPTPWLEAAHARGCPIMDGRELLLYQGADAFTLFTGEEPPLALMRSALYGGGANASLSDSG